MLYLAGQRPPGEGAWLWVTTANARHGGEFTAVFLPRIRPRASGGDVLLRIAPGRGEGDAEQWPVLSVRVWAVAAGSLILVAGWDRLELDSWPERVRATAVFAVGVLARFVGSEAFGLDSLRDDFARFRFLLGVIDGEGVFTPDES